MRIDRIKSEFELAKHLLTISSAFFGAIVAGIINNWNSLNNTLLMFGIIIAIFLAFFVGWCGITLFNKAKLMEDL